MTAWLELLRERVGAIGQQQVADELKVSRPTVSLCLAQKYPAKTDRIALKVMNAYGFVECPFLAKRITFAECRDYHTRPTPTSSAFAVRHWRACQGCPNKDRR